MTLTTADTRLTPGSRLVPRDCPRCHRHLTLADFYRTTRGDGYQRVCKDCYKQPRGREHHARREDLEVMVEGRETLEGAAARLGMRPEALERWCQKHARDLLRALKNPGTGHLRQGRIARSA